jgi:hypothetical protein
MASKQQNKKPTNGDASVSEKHTSNSEKHNSNSEKRMPNGNAPHSQFLQVRPHSQPYVPPSDPS